MADYTQIDRPYDAVGNRTPGGTSPVMNDMSTLGNQAVSASSYTDPTAVGSTTADANYTGTQTTQTPAGAVETQQVNSAQSLNDLWISTFIRSVNWKPNAVGFNIDGLTGKAEFSDVTVRGNIIANTGFIGGFVSGADYIRDVANSFGLASTVTGGDDVRFWAGDTFANRATAPFRVLESGQVFASNVSISGGSIDGSAIFPGTVGYTQLTYPPLNGVTDPSATPGAIGQIYVNTALGRIFISIGTTDANDWALLSSSRVNRLASVNSTLTLTENISIVRI